MKEERGIAGVAFPYVAGIVAAVCSGTSYGGVSAGSICISLYATIVFALLASSGWERLYIPALFACGILTGLTGIETSVSSLGISGKLNEVFAGSMDRAIDRIRFSDRETAAIMKALLTGGKDDMPEDTIEAFRASGASHILALSGFHLGIIYLMVRRMLFFIGNSRSGRIIRSVACIMICFTYTLATGAGPSIVRALIFIIIGESATLSHRYRSTGSILMTAAMIQLTISPLSIQSVGFQLSYSAMAGIAFIYPWISSLWKEEKGNTHPVMKPVRWIWNSIAISLSCQLTTGPLAYLYFHTFPQHFLLTNLIAIPLTTMIIPLSLGTLFCSLCGLDFHILTRATEGLITALSDALHIIASM